MNMKNTRKEINEDCERYISTHYDEVKAACLAIREKLPGSPLYCNGHLLARPLTMQKIYTEEDEKIFADVVSTMHSICRKVIHRYLADAGYRSLFPFSRELEGLILTDPGYDQPLPIARFDIFYNEDTGSYKFCEINTDGTSAMNEDVVWNRLMEDNPAHMYIRQKYGLTQRELFDSWVSAFMDIYSGYKDRVAHPAVAVVDFLDTGTLTEFQEFARHFRKAGYDCCVCDARELRYDGEHLRTKDGAVIDAVYRRAVTSDLMAHFDEVRPLISAIRDRHVFLAGSLRTQVVHNKAFFTIMHLPRTQEFLSDREIDFIREHIPYTCDFGPGSIELDEVLNNKDRYILKPNDSYGASGVADGLGHSPEEWEKICREYYGNGFICQEYCRPYESRNIDFMFGDGRFHNYINMTGLYAYNGKYAGAYTRLSRETLIVSYGNERSVASYYI